MRRTEMLQEIRKMRFEDVYFGWSESRLNQEEAARILGVCDRTFRRYIDRYEEAGISISLTATGWSIPVSTRACSRNDSLEKWSS
jgi:transposase